MKKRQYVVLGVILFILILIITALFSGKGKTEIKKERREREVKYVHVTTAELSDYPVEVGGSGRLSSARNVVLIAEVQGKLSAGEVSLKSGTQFKKGQLLFAIDDTEARLKLQSKKSGFLTLLATSLPDIKIDFPESFNEWDAFFQRIRVNETLPELPEMKSSKGKTYLASRNILGEYYAIRADEELLRKYKAYAPFDGSLIEVYAELGTVVNPGSQISRIIQTAELEVEIPVPIRDAHFIKLGNTAVITVEDRSGKVMGEVVRIGKYVNPNTQSVDVFISIRGSAAENLYNGMYVEVAIQAGVLNEVIKLPRKALISREEVYLVRDSFLIRKTVDVAMSDNQYTYIRGIENGELVVTEPLSNPVDSMRVKTIRENE